MSDNPKTLGVMIERVKEYGIDSLVVRPMQRKAGDGFPANCGWERWYDETATDKTISAAADLVLRACVSDYDGKVMSFEPLYHTVYFVDQHRAAAMAKTLDRIAKRIKKDEAGEHGDKFMAFCKAIGARWFCSTDTKHGATYRYADLNWRFTTLAEGRRHLRNEIEAMEREFAEAHPDKVRAT